MVICANPKCCKEFVKNTYNQKCCCKKCNEYLQNHKPYRKTYYKENSELIKEKSKLWAINNKSRVKHIQLNWIKQNPERYSELNRKRAKKSYNKKGGYKCIKEYRSLLSKRNVDSMTNGYIRMLLAQKKIKNKTIRIISESIITDELIELKRTHIKLKRKIYGKENRTTGTVSASTQ